MGHFMKPFRLDRECERFMVKIKHVKVQRHGDMHMSCCLRRQTLQARATSIYNSDCRRIYTGSSMQKAK